MSLAEKWGATVTIGGYSCFDGAVAAAFADALAPPELARFNTGAPAAAAAALSVGFGGGGGSGRGGGGGGVHNRGGVHGLGLAE